MYVGFHGPEFETPAEIRMAGTVGGDLVGMSTVLEAIAARHLGLDVLGVSLATNLAAGISDVPIDGAHVLAAGDAAGERARPAAAGDPDRGRHRLSADATPPVADLCIANATVVTMDAASSVLRHTSIGVTDDRITSIGAVVASRRTIDAHGAICCRGSSTPTPTWR